MDGEYIQAPDDFSFAADYEHSITLGNRRQNHLQLITSVRKYDNPKDGDLCYEISGKTGTLWFELGPYHLQNNKGYCTTDKSLIKEACQLHREKIIQHLHKCHKHSSGSC